MNLTKTKFTELEFKKVDGIHSFNEMGLWLHTFLHRVVRH